jgi:hypothetical protein
MKEKLNQLEAIYLKAFTLSPDAVNINRLSDGITIDFRVRPGMTIVFLSTLTDTAIPR